MSTFEFRNPLHFEDELEVAVDLAEVKNRSLQYAHSIMRGETLIGTGTMTVVCARKTPGALMQAAEVPAEVVKQLRAALRRANR